MSANLSFTKVKSSLKSVTPMPAKAVSTRARYLSLLSFSAFSASFLSVISLNTPTCSIGSPSSSLTKLPNSCSQTIPFSGVSILNSVMNSSPVSIVRAKSSITLSTSPGWMISRNSFPMRPSTLKPYSSIWEDMKVITPFISTVYGISLIFSTSIRYFSSLSLNFSSASRRRIRLTKKTDIDLISSSSSSRKGSSSKSASAPV